jgi:hypothetical protein
VGGFLAAAQEISEHRTCTSFEDLLPDVEAIMRG